MIPRPPRRPVETRYVAKFLGPTNGERRYDWSYTLKIRDTFSLDLSTNDRVYEIGPQPCLGWCKVPETLFSTS